MSDNGFFRNLAGLANDWVSEKRKTLQGTPKTRAESGGQKPRLNWDGQEISRDELKEIKRIRESGGLIAQLIHSKALLSFGTGVEFHVENNDETKTVVDGEPLTLEEWLQDTFNDVNELVLDIGEDGIWYPYGAAEVVESRSGGFSHIEPVEPWTITPETDQHGDIVKWVQQTKSNGQKYTQEFADDEIKHFIINKSSARDKTGLSEVLRSQEEIEAYRKNQEAMRNAIEMHGFPEWHVQAGVSGASPVNDQDLRRIINMVERTGSGGDTVTATGPDVEFNRLDPGEIKLQEITSNDLQKLALALGVPIEAVDFGSEGLGSGEQSKVRRAILELDIQATQRAYMNQWVTKVIRPVVDMYSPFDADQNLEMRLQDPLTSTTDMADLINKVGDWMTPTEAREKLNLPEKDIDEHDFGPPVDEPSGGEGLFASERTLQDVEDIDTGDYPEAAVENAQMALDAREETGNPNDCGTRVGWERANQLVNGEDLSEDTIERMAAFSRHEENKEQSDKEGQADCGWMMWKAWGGDEGIAWAQEKSEEFEDAREGDTGNKNAEIEAEIDTSELEVSEEELSPYDPTKVNEGDEVIVQNANKTVQSEVVAKIDQQIAVEDASGDRLTIDANGVSLDGEFEAVAIVTPTEDIEQAIARSPEFDRPLLEMHQRLWGEDNTKLLNFTESQTPEFVKDRLRDSIMEGAIFNDFATVTSGDRMQLREFMLETLESDGWTIDGLADQLQQLDGVDSFSDAQRIARTETASVVNTAREEGYKQQGQGDDLFYWSGNLDNRTTDACRWLIEKTNPNHGGDPVSLEELKDLIEEAPTHDDDMDDNMARPENYTVHINERKTFIRAPQ
jgi:hypothetical protein